MPKNLKNKVHSGSKLRMNSNLLLRYGSYGKRLITKSGQYKLLSYIKNHLNKNQHNAVSSR